MNKGRRRLIFVFGGLAAVVGIALVIWIGGKPGMTAPPELTPSVPLPALSSAEFETVTLNNQGKEGDRRKLIAQYFTENLDSVALELVKVPSGALDLDIIGTYGGSDLEPVFET